MNTISLTFTTDGTGHALYTEAIPLNRIGPLSIARATTIEFDNHAQYWRVRDPTGFALFNSLSRQACLDWERRYLESQEDMKHGIADQQTEGPAVSAGIRAA